MNQLNVIFMGNFPYPHGMAITKRKQHFIDFLKVVGVSVSVLLLRQGGVENVAKEGEYQGTKFKTIGIDLKSIFLLINYILYLYEGCKYLISYKKKNFKNYLILTSYIDLENFIFVIFAKMLKYIIVFDKVEDYNYINDNIKLISRFKTKFSLFWEKHIQHFANGIITISYHLYNSYRNNKYNIPVILIPVTANLNEYKEEPKSNTETIFLYAGSFGKKDGLEYLIKGFIKLAKEKNNAVLYLCGKGLAKDIEYYKNLAFGCEKIFFTGYLDDDKYYKIIENADVLLMTRENTKYANAGFPFKIGEYLATGKPVIATKVSDIDKYLEDKKDIILIEPNNSNAIYNAMKFLLDNKKLRIEIGKNGLNKAKINFDKNKNGKLFYEFLKNLKIDESTICLCI